MVERNPPDAALSKILPRQELQPGVTYVSSQFVLSFEHGGKRYAYHTLTRQLLETELIDSFERNTEKEALIRGLFLVPEGKDECAYYQSVSSLMRTLSHKKATAAL